jgi:hypothetical protein
MPTWNAENASCHVYTFKAGLLAAVGHDLKLAVGQFDVQLDGSQVKATFDPSTLQVVCAMKRGKERPGTLSADDKATIAQRTRDDVLASSLYPRIQFVSNSARQVGSTWHVEGTLELHGTTRRVSAVTSSDRGGLLCRLRLHQPDYRIKPFSALMGTLKIKADVEIELRLSE